MSHVNINNIYRDDCRNILKNIKSGSVDLILTDPPYQLGNFRKHIGEWEKEDIITSGIFEEFNRILKEGGYLLCFTANRTIHKFGFAIENAGFEIRDTVIWKYKNQSMPRNMDISKAIDAQVIYGKTSSKYLKMIEQQYGGKEYTVVGTSNTMFGDKVTFNRKEYHPITKEGKLYEGWGTNLAPSYEPIIMARKKFKGSLASNIIKNNVGGLNIEYCKEITEIFPSNILTFDKANRDDFNTHPMVKPVDLLEYLINMTTRSGSIVLDPFMGSGSTIIACLKTQRKYIGIEREKEYFDISKRRMEAMGLCQEIHVGDVKVI